MKEAPGIGFLEGEGRATEEAEDQGGSCLGGANERIYRVSYPAEDYLGAGQFDEQQGERELYRQSDGGGAPGEGPAVLADNPCERDESRNTYDSLDRD